MFTRSYGLILLIAALTAFGCDSSESDTDAGVDQSGDVQMDIASDPPADLVSDQGMDQTADMPIDIPVDQAPDAMSDVNLDLVPDVDPGDPLTALNDEFSGAELGQDWTIFNASMFTRAVTGGELYMTPIPSECDVSPFCVWFENDNGPMVHKLVTGDFKATTRVKARSAINQDQPPPPDYQFAGLIARDPSSDTENLENYVFTVMGERGGWLTNEVKSTVNGSSNVVGPNEGATHADAEVRICRIGQVFTLYNRPIGGDTWELEYTWDRAQNPMADTLQVGLVAYNYTPNVDVVGIFDYIRFASVSSVGDCTTD